MIKVNKNLSILAVILARGGSKGIPKKNIYKINNHPLISYSITAALNSTNIDKLVVSSDSKEILDISTKYGADAIVKRPHKLASDRATSADALFHAVTEAEKIFNKKFQFIIELPCVSPMRDSSDIEKALKILKTKKYDSVVSYVETGEKHPIRLKRIKNNKITNFCKEYKEASWGSIRQDFEPCYIRNGAIYAMTRDCILNKKSRWGKNSYPLIMNTLKSINIDEYQDLLIAKLMIENGYCKNLPQKKYRIEKNKFINKKLTILVTTPVYFLKEFKIKLEKNFNCIFAHGVNLSEIKKFLRIVDYWICGPSPTYKIDKKCLNKSENIKAIFTPSTGSTHIDKKYLKKRKIKLFTLRDHKNLRDIKASSEFTFGLILDALRNLSKGVNSVKSGYWRQQETFLRGNQLFKKKLGIIGFGRIGSNVHKYAKSFGMVIKAYDINKKNQLKKLKLFTNLNSLIKSSDIILVSVHLDKKTRNMVNKNFLKKMKKNSILINISRGEIVDEKHLLNALKKNKIKKAVVDVVKNEQKRNLINHKLIEYSKNNENLTITPHMAGLTFESENIASEIIFKKIMKVIS